MFFLLSQSFLLPFPFSLFFIFGFFLSFFSFTLRSARLSALVKIQAPLTVVFFLSSDGVVEGTLRISVKLGDMDETETLQEPHTSSASAGLGI